ncbi:MAG: glycoside hydrolase family 13 protein, partial [Lachnospiraceae bacterium]
LEELGVECLYINPIFSGDFNHKYATTDYFRVDPIFGTNSTFRELVRTCHKAGIKVLLDGVFNHTGIHFEQFCDVMEKQEESEFKDWFYINKFPARITHRDYECVGAYKWMPKLRSANSKVREFIVSVMEYWIKEFDIDGWRLDVADEVDPSVWEEARRVIKEKYPDVLLLGETWGYGGKMLRGNQMDSVMNYLFRDTVTDYFGREAISVKEFDYRVNHVLAGYKEETNFALYNLLDSHDTERFLFICKENKELFRMAVAFQMMFPGSPAIYYGDEVGITGDNDPDCRRCMVWDETADNELFEWYRKLIKIRKEHPCIRNGKYRTVLAEEKEDTYGFLRFHETDTCYVILHKGKKKDMIHCPVLEQGTYIDMLSGKEYVSENIENESFYNGDITEYRGMVKLELNPYSVIVISKKQGGCKNEEKKKITGNFTHNHNELGRFNGVWKIASRI